MPDLTMCKDKDCPMRDSCFRYTSTPSPFGQSWFAQTPREHATCMEYIPTGVIPDDGMDSCCG